MALTDYQILKDNYPHEDRATLYNSMGGEWPTLVDHPNYQNTCAIRMSLAFHSSNLPIPSSYQEAITGDGKSIVLKVETMWNFVISAYGQPTWGMTKIPGTPASIPVEQGIVVYHAAFSDATGHFDLWTGTDFVGAGKMEDVQNGYDLGLWY